ncbi:hypothetical protein LTR22_026640 [Elasticomyces elasticus]|nr:hypothetical protein LTR22_026640 [Elasticomyces elasticus]KAK4907939.1 hypothetical protein LTR49_023088 [Elasticomyces elasticus]KAK5748122.1 hypothetical protein LTS12_021814 [Elasticomyces elasticus]
MIFATAWNISADLVLLAIPLKIIPGLQLPLRRKIMLICVLGLGVFNILAAILNRYYNLAHPDSTEFLKWYVGEVGTAVYVVNVPACWPLLRKIFPWATRSGTSLPGSGSRLNSYQMRSIAPTKKSIHSMPGMSESEENLASEEHYFQGGNGWPMSDFKVCTNANIDGAEGTKPLPSHAIVKTVGVMQQDTWWNDDR